MGNMVKHNWEMGRDKLLPLHVACLVCNVALRAPLHLLGWLAYLYLCYPRVRWLGQVRLHQ